MRIYAEHEFYINKYLHGRAPKIATEEFLHWSMLAGVEIDRNTFGTLADIAKIPEAVGLCCCEVAEKLYEFEKAKADNGLILKSYGNDGETASFATSGMTEGTLPATIKGIIKRWLANTGYLYCGGGMIAKP